MEHFNSGAALMSTMCQKYFFFFFIWLMGYYIMATYNCLYGEKGTSEWFRTQPKLWEVFVLPFVLRALAWWRWCWSSLKLGIHAMTPEWYKQLVLTGLQLLVAPDLNAFSGNFGNAPQRDSINHHVTFKSSLANCLFLFFRVNCTLRSASLIVISLMNTCSAITPLSRHQEEEHLSAYITSPNRKCPLEQIFSINMLEILFSCICKKKPTLSKSEKTTLSIHGYFTAIHGSLVFSFMPHMNADLSINAPISSVNDLGCTARRLLGSSCQLKMRWTWSGHR